MNIACKMQIDFFHWDNLCITAAARTAFNAKTRSQRRLAQGNDSFFANFIQTVAQTNRNSRFSFAGRSRGHGRSQNQLSAIFRIKNFFLKFAKFRHGNFCFVFSVKIKTIFVNPNFFCNICNRSHFIFLSNFNI